MRTTITPDTVHADFRVLDTVTEPDAPVSTAASFTILPGQPGLQA